MYSLCLLYCITALPNLDISDAFKNILIFGSIPTLYYLYKEKLNREILLLLLICIIIQVLSWVNFNYFINTEKISEPNIKPLTSLFFFVIIALWVGKNSKKRFILYTMLILSFIVTILLHNHKYDSISRALTGSRVDFDLHNAQYTGMIAAICIFLSIYLLIKSLNHKYKHYLVLFWIFCISFCIFIFFVSQTRQVWLATAVILMITPIILHKEFNIKWGVLFYIITLTLLAASLNTRFVEERIESNESQTIKAIVTGDWGNVPMTSFGIRFNSWIETSQWIMDNPIIGASEKAVKQVLMSSEKFQSSPNTKGFGHLHNYYIETLVSFGIIGIIFILYFYYYITKNIKNHSNSSELILYIIFIIFWAIINNFESYNSKYYGLYVHGILLGGIFYIPKIKEKTHS